jgi:hypothetical protein
MIEPFGWSVAMTVSDRGGVAGWPCSAELVRLPKSGDRAIGLGLIASLLFASQEVDVHGPPPTALVLQPPPPPPPPPPRHARWLSLSLDSPPPPSRKYALPAPRSPHGHSGRPNTIPQEHLEPRRFEQVRESRHISYSHPTHPEFRCRCRSDPQRDSQATFTHPPATRGGREGRTRCPLRPRDDGDGTRPWDCHVKVHSLPPL